MHKPSRLPYRDDVPDGDCPAVLAVPQKTRRAIPPHWCELPELHNGAHQCWCGLFFDEYGLVFSKRLRNGRIPVEVERHERYVVVHYVDDAEEPPASQNAGA